ncbi:hypothetical protein HPB51_004991 [Rhipicephalus microplus]|uniref:Uncharacterized protein n=1 Tax=Rhipicephalus microplus TaxID=6941 RepID=A0A9J6EXG8_RHIMP|nr:hypothetical protein HPB51_004991 [Rhipicephalus microplus]
MTAPPRSAGVYAEFPYKGVGEQAGRGGHTMRIGRKVFLLLAVTWKLAHKLPSAQGRSRPQICGCPVYKAASVSNWTTTLRRCDKNEDVRLSESFFQQILSTDFNSWALLHICSDGDRRSKFTLTLRDPLSVIPSDVMTRVNGTLDMLGLSDFIRWTRSPCIIDRTLRQFLGMTGLVIMYPPEGAVLRFDQSLATEKVPRTERTQQTNAPQATIGLTELRMLDDTTTPCGPNVADERSISRDTHLPYVTGQARETIAANDAVVLHESHQAWHRDKLKELSRPQETSGSQETSGQSHPRQVQETSGPHPVETAPTSDQYKHSSQPLGPRAPKQAVMTLPPIRIRTTTLTYQ